MYLERVRLEHVKCFEDIELRFPTDGTAAGFNVILAGNGVGKTTLLQAIAMTLLGEQSSKSDWLPGWVRQGRLLGKLEADIRRGSVDSTTNRPRSNRPYAAKFWVTGDAAVSADGRLLVDDGGRVPFSTAPDLKYAPEQDRASLLSGPHSGRVGWFSCGYGPFRRLTGSDRRDFEEMVRGGHQARFATLFSEGAALLDCERWLTGLHGESNDPSLTPEERVAANQNLVTVRGLLDTLLPGEVKVDAINSKRVRFSTFGGVSVGLEALSDGYRSFLALVLDLARHLQSVFGHVDVNAEGVVLIDEADAHLHPEWQRRLGFELTKVFPNLQFIVTTHSPLVAMAARAGGLFLLAPNEGAVRVSQPIESVQGWRTEQVLRSALFGLTSTRDPDTAAKMTERLQLRARGAQLTPTERAHLDDLDTLLAARLTQPGETLEARDQQREMSAFVEAALAGLRDQS